MIDVSLPTMIDGELIWTVKIDVSCRSGRLRRAVIRAI